jgi:hypothetical protein
VELQPRSIFLSPYGAHCQSVSLQNAALLYKQLLKQSAHKQTLHKAFYISVAALSDLYF